MIDTRDKRSSAIHVGLPWRGMYPMPDGTIGPEDRQQTANFYRGISALIGLFIGSGKNALLVEAADNTYLLPEPDTALWVTRPDGSIEE